MLEREEDLLDDSREVARILGAAPDTADVFARTMPLFKGGKRWRFSRRKIFPIHRRHPKEHQLNWQNGREAITPGEPLGWLN